MTIEEQVLEKLKNLPADKKLEVLDFAEFLDRRPSALAETRADYHGIFRDSLPDIPFEEFKELRREISAKLSRKL